MSTMYEPTGFALEIFRARHAAHDKETWKEASERVALHVSNAEAGEARNTWRDTFYQVLHSNLFMPGGRIWYGSGRPRGQLLNCFVVPTSDSREGWGKTISDTLIISGTGGGVGINFSPTRPRGTPIRGTGGTATGSVSEMEIVNSMGNVLKSGGGRRMALMFALSLSHGDVIEFMDKKLDRRELNNANVSIVFDDDPEVFFRLVHEGKDFPLIHQGRQVGAISAALLWRRIVENAIKPREGGGGGEPGLLNSYLANRMSNIWYVEQLVCTNPCFAPDTRIATDHGLVRIEDLAKAGRTARVVTDRRVGKSDGLSMETPGTRIVSAIDVEIKAHSVPVFKVTTEHGYTVTATSEHNFITTSGRKRLDQLVLGDVLMLPSGEGAFGARGNFDEGFVLGLHVSDGTCSHYDKVAFLDVWADDFQDLDIIEKAVQNITALMPTGKDRAYGQSWFGDTEKKRIGGVRLYRWLSSVADREDVRMLKQRVPESVWQGSRDFVRGYLQGLFYGDGTLGVGGHATKQTVSWRLAQSNRLLLEDVQRLLTSFGIVSRLYSRRPAGLRSLPDGKGGSSEYVCREDFELIISRPNLITWRSLVGMRGRKAALIDGALGARGTECRKPERHITRIAAIEPAGISDVYCLTQPETNCVISDGIVNGQCGEIWLSPYDCCCLGALVLPRFVKGGKVQWELLRETITTGVRFLDDVLTVNQYPLPEIAQKCAQLRRIGLGITGLHHMLLELGHGYNTPEGLEFVDKLMGFVKNSSYEASADLATEKGSFAAFDSEKFLKSQFVKTIKPTIRAKIKAQGMRNCAVNTIAPVGTGSIICDTSSAIEPIFAVAHKRKYRDGDQLAEEVVLDPMFARAVAEGRETSHFLGAHEISMRDHFEMQRVCQRHVDNAVSKTINLPKGTSPDELSELYMEFLPELKGVTVYPDGSREDQPLTPLSREEAVRLATGATTETSADRCRSGSCDL